MNFLGLVDLDMLLHAAHHRTSQVFEPDRILRDFAKCDHRVLVVIAVECQRSTRGDFAGTLRREQHQLKPIRNFENTIFHGNARHCDSLHRLGNQSIYGAYLPAATASVASGVLGSLRLTLAGAGVYMAPLAGRMAEWLCRGLQILVQRFDSASGLQGLSPLKQTLSSPVYRLCHRLPTAPSV